MAGLRSPTDASPCQRTARGQRGLPRVMACGHRPLAETVKFSLPMHQDEGVAAQAVHHGFGDIHHRGNGAAMGDTPKLEGAKVIWLRK
jgi:hypothetical protein